jgi:galactose-1-phosphate uridylyltransferase
MAGGPRIGPGPGSPPYDPECYLCPGNGRANGERNPAYTETHAFTNDFAALRPSTPEVTWGGGCFVLSENRAPVGSSATHRDTTCRSEAWTSARSGG